MSLSTHSDGGQQSLGNISNNDSDEEDDGLQPGVTQDDWQDEERHAEEDGHACDDLDEVLDLLSNGCLKSRRRRRCLDWLKKMIDFHWNARSSSVII